jgi:hypothetical protein
MTVKICFQLNNVGGLSLMDEFSHTSRSQFITPHDIRVVHHQRIHVLEIYVGLSAYTVWIMKNDVFKATSFILPCIH